MRTSTWGTTTWTPWSRTPTPIMELIDCDTFYICISRIQPKRNCYKLSTIWGVAFFVCVCNTTCVPLCYHVSHGGDKKLIVAPSDEIMARVFECFILASQLLQAKGKLVFLKPFSSIVVVIHDSMIPRWLPMQQLQTQETNHWRWDCCRRQMGGSMQAQNMGGRCRSVWIRKGMVGSTRGAYYL